MASTINGRMRIKHDTAENWDAQAQNVNATPLEGELIGYGNKLKLGDGSTSATELPGITDECIVGLGVAGNSLIVNKENGDSATMELPMEIYVGDGDMPEGCVLKIDPSATAMQAAAYAVYSTTIPRTGWSAAAPYSITIPMNGILSTDIPLGPDIIQTGDETVDEPMRKAWQKVTRMTSADGSVTFYAGKEVPDVELPVQWMVIR